MFKETKRMLKTMPKDQKVRLILCGISIATTTIAVLIKRYNRTEEENKAVPLSAELQVELNDTAMNKNNTIELSRFLLGLSTTLAKDLTELVNK